LNIPKLFEWLCKLSIALADIDEYLKGILGQVLASYKILTELTDNPTDLEIIKKELSKIRGLLQVISSKLGEKKYQSDHLVALYKLSPMDSKPGAF
jgi:hypothetical protein